MTARAARAGCNKLVRETTRTHSAWSAARRKAHTLRPNGEGRTGRDRGRREASGVRKQQIDVDCRAQGSAKQARAQQRRLRNRVRAAETDGVKAHACEVQQDCGFKATTVRRRLAKAKFSP